MLSYFVRNTFVDVECEDSDAQPGLSRAETEPLPRGGVCQRVSSDGSSRDEAQHEGIHGAAPQGLQKVCEEDDPSPGPAALAQGRDQQACCDTNSTPSWGRQFEPDMLSVTVRNTFLHVECADSDAQPGLSRAESEPVPRGDLVQHIRSCSSIPEEAQDDHADDATPLGQETVWRPDEEQPKVWRKDDPSPLPTLLGHGHRIQQERCDTSSAVRYKKGRAKQEPIEQTTIMLRNLPNGYTRDDVICLLALHGFGERINFLYLPIDFETRAALGYAFINTFTQADAELLWRCMEGFSRWSLPSSKVCKVSWSNPLQGFEANVERYRNSPVMHEAVPDVFRPMLFNSFGDRIPFPPPTKKIKAPRKGTKLMLTGGVSEAMR